jgi:hypothetical protein
VPVRPTHLDCDIIALDITEFTQAFAARLPKVLPFRGRERKQITDPSYSLRLLRTRAARQHNRCRTKNTEKFPPAHDCPYPQDVAS